MCCIPKLHCSQCLIALRHPLRCSRCVLTFYCSPKHQSEHYSQHKEACLKVKKTKDLVNKEKEKILRFHPQAFTPTEEFQMDFHLLHPNTDDFLKAMYNLSVDLQSLNTQEAIEASLKNALESLHCSRKDQFWIRHIVAIGYLQLQKFQKCFDFMMYWWNLPKQHFLSPPPTKAIFLKVSGSNLLQDTNEMFLDTSSRATESLPLVDRVLLLLLKYNCYVALSDMVAFDTFLLGTHGRLGEYSQVKKLAGSSLVLDCIQSFLHKNDAVPKRRVIRSESTVLATVLTLRSQCDALFNVIHQCNSYFWLAVKDPQQLKLKGANAKKITTAGGEYMTVEAYEIEQAFDDLKIVGNVVKCSPKFLTYIDERLNH